MRLTNRNAKFLFGYTTFFTVALYFALNLAGLSSAHAVELDWSGQFRADSHIIPNYTMDASSNGPRTDTARLDSGGYYIPGGGMHGAYFQTLFMRLNPKVLVNDNIAIKSEFWLGDPVYGIYGGNVPKTNDQRQFYSTQSAGSVITAQRYWAEVYSDLGTFQIGRAPLNWGLGIVWNDGADLWSRYMTTADVVRLNAKFGAFSFIPTWAKYSSGNTVGGNCSASASCAPRPGRGNVVEVAFALQYNNLDENMDLGVNLVHRVISGEQDTAGYRGFSGGTAGVRDYASTAGSSYSIWDIYAKKKIGKFSFGIEVPVISGTLGPNGSKYKTYAIATETVLEASPRFNLQLKAGQAPGQPNVDIFADNGATIRKIDSFRGFYFHPNYRLGLIMFNYQLANMAGPNTDNDSSLESSKRSVFDNPISNARYASLRANLFADKWSFYTQLIYAIANQAAEPNKQFYNTWERRIRHGASNVQKQGKRLGIEFDWGTFFKWDDHFGVGADFGVLFPGEFYKFSNSAHHNLTRKVFAATLKAGVTF